MINIDSAVNNRAAINITADISRCVADINDFRRIGINIDIFHVVNRTTRRNRVYHLRHCYAYLPRSPVAASNKPYPIMPAVVVVAIADYRVGGIDSIVHVCAFYLFKFRITVIYYHFFAFTAFDSCGLRNVRLEYGLLGLLCASDAGLLAYREIDDVFGLTDMVACELKHKKNFLKAQSEF
jgi:hypothetical protein